MKQEFFIVNNDILKDVIFGRDVKIKEELASKIFESKGRVLLTDSEIEVFVFPKEVEHTIHDFSICKFVLDEVR